MKSNKTKICSIFLAVLMLLGCVITVNGAAEHANNRYNVVFVVDASGSMYSTDPEDLRFNAINLFIDLLAETGNYLGGVVFASEIEAKQELAAINSRGDKDTIANMLTSIKTEEWTNTGDALNAAVDIVEGSKNDLPSVIVFLCDGKTELPDDKDTELSLDKKAEAIQRAREGGIPIYSVCLNANHNADVSEMEQISKATGGEFREVNDAADLVDVFNAFYNFIYGTATTKLVDEVFPANGIVEKEFKVPGIGVEEVNIVIYGSVASLDVYRPDGKKSECQGNSGGDEGNAVISTVKITDIQAGTWKIVTSGVPGDQVKINMVFNTDLKVDLDVNNSGVGSSTEEDVTFKASLSSGGKTASTEEDYYGFSAKLHVLNHLEEELDVIDMPLNGDRFELTRKFDEGTYKFKVTVSGFDITKESAVSNPFRVVTEIPEPESGESIEDVKDELFANSAPVANASKVEEIVYIWPFVDSSFSIELSTLATDAEDSTLDYKIVSSSFMEGDYEITPEGVLTINHFSLSKGAFTIKAVDSGGLSCDVEIVVISRNVGLMALIGIGTAAIITLAVLGIMLYILLNKRFMGACYVTKFDADGNYYEEVKREKGRGRIPLSAFGIGNTGFDASKCYFQATGKGHVYFITNKNAYGNGMIGKKFKIDGSGYDTDITVEQFAQSGIRVKFVSRLNNTNFTF